VGCASTPKIPSDSILNSGNLKGLEKRSLNPNPSFEQGAVGWVTSGSGSGGEIEVIPNQNDLVNGKQAMRLKPSSGYTRLTVKDPIRLSAGKNYQMILVIQGKVTIGFFGTDGWGGIDANTQVEGIIHRYEHGKTIVTRKVASKNGHVVTPTFSHYVSELIVEHFFVIEEIAESEEGKPKTK
jgi:hypothetical protein